VRQSLLFKRITQFVVAILLAAIAAAAYRSFVFSQFVPIRVDVMSEELHSSNHAVKVTLPDFSTLRGQTAVLGLRLQNTRTERRQIGLLRDGFPNNRIVLPPNRTIRWDIVLSPETVRALAAEVGDAARSLELTGDADGWALTALEIRNYHARFGDRLMTVALPRQGDAYTSGTGFLPVGIALLLALVTAFGPTPQRKSLRLIGNGLALTAFLVCVACLILPWISSYRVLLSQPAFALVAAALFSTGLLIAARQLPAIVVAMAGAISRGFAIVTRRWTRHAVTYERGAALLALVAIAIAQPIFEVVSDSPEFFAARSTTGATAVVAVLAICLGIPFGLLGIERAIRVVSRRAAATFFGIVLAVLSAAVVMPWFRRGEVLISPWDALISALVGLAVALAHGRSRIIRQFLTALAPAALVVPALFLLDPDVAQTFLPSESAAAVQTIERTPPIVFVVFDELPLNSLLTAGGDIDAERYPNFAALVREAYWFRDASTVAGSTSHAVPAILSGRYPTARAAAPTLRDYPVNLFTTLARHYDIFASLRFQQLCPPRACQYNSAMPADTVGSLLSDLGLVWLHIVLPQKLSEELPPVTDDWAEFARTRETRTEIRNSRGGAFAEFLSSIDGQPARLHFIHLVLPHMPFEYVASGRRYRGPDYQTHIYRGKRLFEGMSAEYADTLHQRHLAQVGYVDRLLGDLIMRLREVGAYDKALVIVTADHGGSYREGRPRRQLQRRNLSDILLVPLLMKVPGQRRGEVVDRIVETVDILPTILDVVGANASLRLDGRSLIAGRVPARSSRTFIARNRFNATARTYGDLSADRAASLERKERRFGRGDGTALYAPPGVRHLLGMNVSRSAMSSARDVQITIRNPRQFEAVNLARDPLPLYVGGVLSTSRSEPLTVAVVVNGTVAAVTHSYREHDAHRFDTLIPETSLRDGNNIVAALVVDVGAATHTSASGRSAPTSPARSGR
jgi:Sulfatase